VQLAFFIDLRSARLNWICRITTSLNANAMLHFIVHPVDIPQSVIIRDD